MEGYVDELSKDARALLRDALKGGENGTGNSRASPSLMPKFKPYNLPPASGCYCYPRPRGCEPAWHVYRSTPCNQSCPSTEYAYLGCMPSCPSVMKNDMIYVNQIRETSNECRTEWDLRPKTTYSYSVGATQACSSYTPPYYADCHRNCFS